MYTINMKYIKRPYYTDKIIPYIDKQLIKVLTGQRRFLILNFSLRPPLTNPANLS